VSSDGLGTGPPNDSSKHEHDNDGVVRVADNRDEVGYEVDRRCEVRQEKPEPYPQVSREGLVTSEAVREADNVGNSPERLVCSPFAGTKPPKYDKQSEPTQDESHHDGEDKLDCPVHLFRLSRPATQDVIAMKQWGAAAA
jgi:hypothetical protein